MIPLVLLEWKYGMQWRQERAARIKRGESDSKAVEAQDRGKEDLVEEAEIRR